MARTELTEPTRLPGRFEALVRLMPPRAISDDAEHETMLAMVDRLMATPRLTRGQAVYLETLVQLVEAYEAEHHAIDTSEICAIDALRHLTGEAGMSASDLARLLGVHPSMGSKILKGHRSLTLAHVRTLASHFRVDPALFVD